MTLEPEPIIIACAADQNYAMPLVVTVCSLLRNLQSGQRVVLYVLDGGIQRSQKDRVVQSTLHHNIEIIWITPSSVLANLLSDNVILSEKWPIANYYRLLLPHILPPHIAKVMYLDTDLVIQGDLTPLWQIDMGHNYALAVQDVCQPHIATTKHLDHRKFGVSEDCKYFNAGVLVMNLKQWREDNITDKTLALIAQHKETLLFPDQDALNIVLAQRWGELPPRWNQMHGIYDFSSWAESPYRQADYDTALKQPDIIHFTTLPKPWMKGCTHPNQDLFYHYLDRTAWKGWRNTIWRRLGRRITKEIKQLVSS